MGWQVIEQPDGKYCIWSSFVDDLIVVDASWEDLEEVFMEKAVEAEKRHMEGLKKRLEKKAPYYQFTKTWEDVKSFYDTFEEEAER